LDARRKQKGDPKVFQLSVIALGELQAYFSFKTREAGLVAFWSFPNRFLQGSALVIPEN
jgi:hypothetical protein